MNTKTARHIRIDLNCQQLQLFDGDAIIQSYAISSAANGAGEEMGSECTPRGRHRIRIKIGGGCPENAVFVGRRFTDEICTPDLYERFPERDWVLTRILWLTGLEPGHNRGGAVDSLRRYIYIHGCPDAEPMGEPRSHGCIRMRNSDLIGLFDLVEAGTLVDIR